jgi:prolyl oligopeptidase PreP (S9A serine peptidase family)
MSKTILSVSSVENRGGDEVAWGFVYFSDDTRVAYNTNMGGVQEGVTGGWDEVTPEHVKLAVAALNEMGVPSA